MPRTAIQFQGLLEFPIASTEKFGYSPSLPPLHLFHVIGGLAIDMQISCSDSQVTRNRLPLLPTPALAKDMLIGQRLGVRLANQLSFTGNVCQKFLGLQVT